MQCQGDWNNTIEPESKLRKPWNHTLVTERNMVIVGAGEAGTAAAIALRKKGWPGRLVLVGREVSLPYERPPLSKAILVEDRETGPRFIVTSERLADLSIEHLEGRIAESINRAARTISLSGGAQLSYERLLLATGARPRSLRVPIATGSKITTLRTYSDALTIRRNISRGHQVVVVGGGFIGLEVAASVVLGGGSATVIETGQRLLMRAVPSAVSELIRTKHEGLGVRIETNATVKRIDVEEGRSKVILGDGRRLLGDLVVIGIGAEPNTELAQAAGLVTDNGVVVDEMLTTSDSNIFAAGDCCMFPHPLYGARIRVEAWRNALRQGAAAAANMLGEKKAFGDVPWFWSDQYDDTLQIAGIYRPEDMQIERKLGIGGTIFFYFDADGRLTAACGFGSNGAIAKEIRLAETMIARRMTPSADAIANPKIGLKTLLV